MIEPEENSNIKWEIGDRVDSVAGIFKNGEVLRIVKKGNMTLLDILWENGVIQTRSDSIVRKRNVP